MYLCYGRHTNLELLEYYGFVLPTNSHDTAQLPTQVLTQLPGMGVGYWDGGGWGGGRSAGRGEGWALAEDKLNPSTPLHHWCNLHPPTPSLYVPQVEKACWVVAIKVAVPTGWWRNLGLR